MGFDPTNPVQAAVFSSKDVTVTINGATFPSAISSISKGVAVEGVEHQFALGDPNPFALNDGNIKPKDTVWKVHAHALLGILTAIAPDGNYIGVSFDMEVILDKASSPGFALLSLAAKLPTTSASLIGCKITDVASSYEANGAALTVDVTAKVLRYTEGGAAGAIVNAIVGLL